MKCEIISSIKISEVENTATRYYIYKGKKIESYFPSTKHHEMLERYGSETARLEKVSYNNIIECYLTIIKAKPETPKTIKKEIDNMKKQNHEFYAWNEFGQGAKIRSWTEPHPETNYYDILYNGKSSKVYAVAYKNGIRMLQVIGNRGCLGWIPAFIGEEYINGEKVRYF